MLFPIIVIFWICFIYLVIGAIIAYSANEEEYIGKEPVGPLVFSIGWLPILFFSICRAIGKFIVRY